MSCTECEKREKQRAEYDKRIATGEWSNKETVFYLALHMAIYFYDRKEEFPPWFIEALNKNMAVTEHTVSSIMAHCADRSLTVKF